MRTELSDKLLRTLKAPESGRIEVSDSKCPGLRVRVHASGKMSWIFEKRVKRGLKRKHHLGYYPDLGLASARKIGRQITVEAAQGHDRVLAAEDQRLAEETARATRVTVAEVIEVYDQLHLTPNLRTGVERKRQLRSSLSSFLDHPIKDLTAFTLQSAVDRKATEGRLGAANRICAALSSFMSWSASRGYIDTNIGANLRKPSKETPRDLVLSVEQVRQIWMAAADLGELWRPLVRLMVITAQRRGDIVGLTWSEIDLSTTRIAIDGRRTKNGRPHVVHLSEPALAEIQFIPRTTDLLFSTTGRTPVSGFSKVKARLDALLGEDFPDWRFHDLRTAFATAVADAGEPEGVVDRVLNHVASASSASAVARTYNRAELLPQRAAVLDRWAEIVTKDMQP